jgi:hypothetical protein
MTHTATTLALVGTLTAVTLSVSAGPAAAREPYCESRIDTRILVAPGTRACVGLDSPRVDSRGVTHAVFSIAIKDTVRDGHCAYLHLQHRGDSWPGHVIKACGVGTVTTVRSMDLTVATWSSDVFRWRTHEGYGRWSRVTAWKVNGHH